MQSNKIIIALLLSLLLSATHTTAGPGVASDGSDGVADSPQIDQVPEAGGDVRYLLPYMRSAEFSTGAGGRVSTVITATNGGTTACNVTVDYYFAFNADTLPECSLTLPLGPLLAVGGSADTANACSRTISGDRWTLCTATCNPSLGFVQGKAIINVPASCAGAVTFDARLYHSDTADDVRAINALRVFRLRD